MERTPLLPLPEGMFIDHISEIENTFLASFEEPLFSLSTPVAKMRGLFAT
jgi:hypothetical protein